MNIFAHIERLDKFQFELVKYYSVHFEKNDVNEFYDFLNRIEDNTELKEDISNLLVWIEEIGENIGALDKFFRNESITADVRALPPPFNEMKTREVVVNDLRLYCLVLNKHVVFLFNGGIKTTPNAKDCPNVGPYIKQANMIAKKIDNLISCKEIKWNENNTDIIFDENIEIEL